MKPRRTPPSASPRKGSAEPPDPQAMARLLERCGIHLTGSQLDQLWVYHGLLRRYDAELNLTRIRNFANMVVKLYADAILPALHIPQLPSPLLDLGSGAGMPGIPLKIFQPGLHVLLAESRLNRSAFLRTVVDRLGLSGLEVIDRGIAPDFDRPVAGVITRAVEPIADTLARVSGCLTAGGRVIFMKGPRCDEEIAAAISAFAGTHEQTQDIAYRIPHTPHQRRLVIFRSRVGPRHYQPTTAAVHRIKIIDSAHNPVFRQLKKLLGGRGVKKEGQTLVCGRRLAVEAVHHHSARCRAWISSGPKTPPPSSAPPSLQWIQLAPDLFPVLDVFGTRHPMVLLAVPPLDPWRPEDRQRHGCGLLVPFQDPENVGTVIRSAAALAVDRIILLAESANPFHPKAVRASAGTVFSAPLLQGPALSDLPPDLPVVALAASGRPITDIAFPPSFYLLPGMEGPGLPSRWEADAVAIPMTAGVESLNAAVATAIALYEWRRQFPQPA